MTMEELMAENAALREQVAESNKILDSIVDAVLVADATGKIIKMNAAAEANMKKLDQPENSTEDWQGQAQLSTYFRADGVTPMPVEEIPLSRALSGEVLDNAEMCLRTPALPAGQWIQCSGRPLYGPNKEFRGAVVIYRDITDRKHWERELERQLQREKEKNELLERMRKAMEELSTPILEVWNDVLAVPVIGLVDSQRASDMMSRVLEAVERKQCRFLIIDITGVDVIDTATADRFMKLVTAAEILGAQCFLTGARAVVAQALASLGMELKGLTTLRNLKHGLSECMRIMEATSRQPLRDTSHAGQGRG